MADRKSKAKGVPPTTASPDESDQAEKSQRERFIEAGIEAGVTTEGFDKAVGKIAPPRKRTAP